MTRDELDGMRGLEHSKTNISVENQITTKEEQMSENGKLLDFVTQELKPF